MPKGSSTRELLGCAWARQPRELARRRLMPRGHYSHCDPGGLTSEFYLSPKARFHFVRFQGLASASSEQSDAAPA
jgi:hypothetical protein